MSITRKATRQLAAERRLRTAVWAKPNHCATILKTLLGAAVFPALLALLLWGVGS